MRFRASCLCLLLIAALLFLLVPMTANAYDREAAKSYAENWAESHNPAYDWYTDPQGGDCANFVSQSIHQGGVSMSHNDPYWRNYKNQNNVWVVSNSWKLAYSLFNYWKTSPRSNYRSLVDTWDWLASTGRGNPPNNIPGVVRGDLLSYVTGSANNNTGFDGSSWEDIDHSAIVTGLNSHSTYVYSYQGTLICQHSTDRYRVFWTAEDRLPPQEWRKWGYVCWRLSTSLH